MPIGRFQRPAWLCRCACGTQRTVTANNLLTGASSSCGCLRDEERAERVARRGRDLPDLTGLRFGRWAIVSSAGKVKTGGATKYAWLCRCDCGTERVVTTQSLSTGGSRSCGCLSREVTGSLRRTHGMTGTKAYVRWVNMRDRCFNRKNKRFRAYGGRGITICERWLGESGFANFYADMGEPPTPNHSIDRIDVNGDYTPENCRWATQKEQLANRRKHGVVQSFTDEELLAELRRRGVRVRVAT